MPEHRKKGPVEHKAEDRVPDDTPQLWSRNPRSLGEPTQLDTEAPQPAGLRRDRALEAIDLDPDRGGVHRGLLPLMDFKSGFFNALDDLVGPLLNLPGAGPEHGEVVTVGMDSGPVGCEARSGPAHLKEVLRLGVSELPNHLAMRMLRKIKRPEPSHRHHGQLREDPSLGTPRKITQISKAQMSHLLEGQRGQ